ncbi:hypothetical protein D7Y41_31100 [Anaerotruncus sp. 1XD22-93]|nr:hypothetical protein D7Y41_31100 [Anaerotruncus sp. 1XD22-93]
MFFRRGQKSVRMRSMFGDHTTPNKHLWRNRCRPCLQRGNQADAGKTCRNAGGIPGSFGAAMKRKKIP